MEDEGVSGSVGRRVNRSLPAVFGSFDVYEIE